MDKPMTAAEIAQLDQCEAVIRDGIAKLKEGCRNAGETLVFLSGLPNSEFFSDRTIALLGDIAKLLESLIGEE